MCLETKFFTALLGLVDPSLDFGLESCTGIFRSIYNDKFTLIYI